MFFYHNYRITKSTCKKAFSIGLEVNLLIFESVDQFFLFCFGFFKKYFYKIFEGMIVVVFQNIFYLKIY